MKSALASRFMYRYSSTLKNGMVLKIQSSLPPPFSPLWRVACWQACYLFWNPQHLDWNISHQARVRATLFNWGVQTQNSVVCIDGTNKPCR